MVLVDEHTVRPVGWVESCLVDRALAPRQPDEGAPQAVLRFLPEYEIALEGVVPGDKILLLTWLHRADRTVLRVHPRDDMSRPLAGVFATRSSDRPNPIGAHHVTVVEVQPSRITVDRLEAIDGTPILDVKPELGDVPPH